MRSPRPPATNTKAHLEASCTPFSSSFWNFSSPKCNHSANGAYGSINNMESIPTFNKKKFISYKLKDDLYLVQAMEIGNANWDKICIWKVMVIGNLFCASVGNCHIDHPLIHIWMFKLINLQKPNALLTLWIHKETNNKNMMMVTIFFNLCLSITHWKLLTKWLTDAV